MPVLPVGAAAGALPAAPVRPPVQSDPAGFAEQVAKGLDSLQAVQSDADALAAQAATGDLTDVHDYMIASAKASLATELTVAVRNKAVEAFNEIMRMQI